MTSPVIFTGEAAGRIAAAGEGSATAAQLRACQKLGSERLFSSE
jgi:hypothetical protein